MVLSYYCACFIQVNQEDKEREAHQDLQDSLVEMVLKEIEENLEPKVYLDLMDVMDNQVNQDLLVQQETQEDPEIEVLLA